MTEETWDVDQAVTRGPWDEALEGRRAFARYGVTEREEIAGEPLEVALAQEEPDTAPFTGTDDQWVLVESEETTDRPWHSSEDGPETAALHVVTTGGWFVEEES
ncbi:MAG TPA: hypothetical protein VFJ17_04855 [Mycobacteriales bacterium]|jgi:hypothetical protein|nr:hypothetical protein [Mycobacteriales bacterium]